MALYSDNYFNSRLFASYLISIIILVGSPIAGMAVAGFPVSHFLEFPPLTRYVAHAPKNHVAFLLSIGFSIILLTPLALRFLKYFRQVGIRPPAGKFPKWGLLGLGLMAVSWGVAWNIITTPQSVRMWTFTPLWLGFIIFLNALTQWRLGSCLMLRRPLAFMLLFFLSSLFWWYFEFMNRFVQNWYYIGVSNIGPAKYVFMASLSFSTVLPAVLSLNELLKCTCAFEKAFDLKCHFVWQRWYAFVMLVFSISCLIFLGRFPDILFPFLWISPLLVICNTKKMLGVKENLIDAVLDGRLGAIARLAVSGLVCGFFWEMWNFWSYPKWIYSIPYVAHFKIFEMPLLGYLGYLPFGLECASVAAVLIPLSEILNNSVYSTIKCL